MTDGPPLPFRPKPRRPRRYTKAEIAATTISVTQGKGLTITLHTPQAPVVPITAAPRFPKPPDST